MPASLALSQWITGSYWLFVLRTFLCIISNTYVCFFYFLVECNKNFIYLGIYVTNVPM